MRRVDEYLSRKANAIPAFQRAIVFCDDSGPKEVWTLERHGAPPIGIGSSFQAARRAIIQLKLAASEGKA